MTWHQLTKKPVETLTDADRVAIAAVVHASTHERSAYTMEEIYAEFLGIYNHIFAHCDPLPRGRSTYDRHTADNDIDSGWYADSATR